MIEEVQLSHEEISYVFSLIDALPDKGLMIEWGSGGSTERWLRQMKGRQRLISIEHHKGWYDKVLASVVSQNLHHHDRFSYFYRPIKCKDYEHVYSYPSEENPYGCDEYIYPDDEIWNADIYFIDGVARNACAMATLILSKKPDPVILIHDYAAREHWYATAVMMAPKSFYQAGTFTRLFKK